jgi:hypothetical protein
METDPSARQVLQALKLPAEHLAWLEALAEVGAPASGVHLPQGAEADRTLTRLGLSEVDRREALAAMPSAQDHPRLWWVLERCQHLLAQRMGTTGPLPDWPRLPDELGPVGRYFYTWVFVAGLPAVRAYHRAHRIPDDLSWEILAVLGSQMADRRAIHGTGGLHTQSWMTVHFRGAIYSLGRLHFERQRIWFDAPRSSDASRSAARKGDWGLGLHIPEGRLTPESVDAALDQARGFFAEHFPDEEYQWATCVSWVLDDQLREYLRPDSNIVRFQQRFELMPAEEKNDNPTVVQFLFKRPLSDLAGLPRDSSLQRGVIDHIRAGRAWRFRTGWFRLS